MNVACRFDKFPLGGTGNTQDPEFVHLGDLHGHPAHTTTGPDNQEALSLLKFDLVGGVVGGRTGDGDRGRWCVGRSISSCCSGPP